MKTSTLTMSLALLVATFMWGCQEQGSGPVGPEGLGPQFDKPGEPGELCPGAGAGGPVRDDKGHCHDDEEPPADPPPRFNITIVSDQIPVTTPQEFSRPGILDVDFELDLSLFAAAFLDCPTLAGSDPKIGQFTIFKGDAGGPHVHVAFQFMHTEDDGVESKHSLSMDGVPLPPNVAWDPTLIRRADESPEGFGHWTLTAKGKNHQNGCKGEDNGVSGGDDDLSFTITVSAPL